MRTPFVTLTIATFVLASALSVPAAAQGGLPWKAKGAEEISFTPEQQQSVNKAIEYLNATGEALPAGWTVVAIDTQGKAPSMGDPNSKKIGIDFEVLEKKIPKETPGAPGKPGLVCVLLIHEYAHIKVNPSMEPCNELKIVSDTAVWHCEFICLIKAAGGGPLDSLCRMYRHVGEKYKEAKSKNPQCNLPNEIPRCGCCT